MGQVDWSNFLQDKTTPIKIYCTALEVNKGALVGVGFAQLSMLCAIFPPERGRNLIILNEHRN
jgi:hypothetical protein